MMPLKNNQSDSKDSQEIEKSKALNTEEILSLLSKTSNDFTRESEISENISNLFKKTSLKEMANSTSQKANLEAEDNIKKQEDKKNIQEKKTEETNLETKEKQEKLEEKKYSESEARNIADKLAKESFNKGYQQGVNKIKEELQQGEKALAVSFKNALDNIFSISPTFCEKLNSNISKNFLQLTREILGYEIDTKTENYLKKIIEFSNSVENSLKNIKIYLCESDHKAISEFIKNKGIQLDFDLSIDKKLQRGDLSLKSGSIEIGEIVANKVNFPETNNTEEQIKKIKENNKEIKQNVSQ